MTTTHQEEISAQVAEVVSQQLLKVLETKESELDEEIRYLEQANDDDLERLRHNRLRELKRNAVERERWIHLGHGQYQEVEEKDFFEIAKQSPLMVVHFYRPTTRRCQILDKHLFTLASKHLETRFMKINAEKAHFLASRLNIRVIPTTVLVKNGKTEHNIIGFEEFGGSDDFSLSDVEAVLKKWEMIGAICRAD